MDQTLFTTIETTFNQFIGDLETWLADHGLQVVGIIISAWLIKKFGTMAIMKVLQKTVRRDLYPTKTDRTKRLKTLESLIGAILNVAVFIIAIIMILSELGVNTAPIVASAGIVGIALGFGAQSLVKDLVSGMFLIIENQYRVGDVVELNHGIVGQIEAITIRTTLLRTLDGTLYHVPNGSITWTANKTSSFAGLSEEIVFPREVDIEKLKLIINRAGKKLAKNPKYAKMIIDPPEFLRVDGIDTNGIRIKIIGKTGSDDAWDIKGAFYQQLITDLRNADIPLPYNHMEVSTKTTKKTKS